MSTKKIVLIIAGIVAVLVLIVALFVGGIAFFIFRTIGNSDAANTARTYLRNNETLKQVIGEKRDVNARVDLQYRNNRAWRVTGASYDRDGQTIDLLPAYDSAPSPP